MNDVSTTPSILSSNPGNLASQPPFFALQFQDGSVTEVGINGCRVEDVIVALMEKLKDYQSGSLACLENDETLHYLERAHQAQTRRRKLREDQGVINTLKQHESLFKERTEDEEHDFSATGA